MPVNMNKIDDIINRQTDRQTFYLMYTNVHSHTKWFTIQCTGFGLVQYLNEQKENKENKVEKKKGGKERNQKSHYLS